jgi:hypothetical protein
VKVHVPRAWLAVLGVFGAVLVAVAANVESHRHPYRWDLSSSRRYSLSTATIETLRTLPATVHLWLLVGEGEALGQSLRQTLRSYAAFSNRIDLQFVDPDREPLRFDEVRRRFRIEAGRTEEGRVVTDAVIVVEGPTRRWFVTPQDLAVARAAKDPTVRPREEQAITLAIRQAMGGDRRTVCISRGHGELPLEDPGPTGMLILRTVLEKNNDVVRVVDFVPGAVLADCSMILVAGSKNVWPEPEAKALAQYVAAGGSLVLGLGPARDAQGTIVSLGLQDVLRPYGIALVDGLLIEEEATRRTSNGEGAELLTDVLDHPATAGLVGGHVRLSLARPLVARLASDGTRPVELLVTSPSAHPMAGLGRSRGDELAPQSTGPYVVAWASERVSHKGATPSRAVVIGTASVFANASWSGPSSHRGAPLFVEGALSWVASRPRIVDVPDRPPAKTDLDLTQASVDEVRRYVLFYMPAAAVLFGIAVHRARRGKARKDRP